MKIAKGRRLQQVSLPIEFDPGLGIVLSAREERLLNLMARNTPAENYHLAKRLSYQRHRMRHPIAVVRRYARRIAKEHPSVQQSIRQLQNSPFYVGFGSLSALQAGTDEWPVGEEFDWLLEEEGSDV